MLVGEIEDPPVWVGVQSVMRFSICTANNLQLFASASREGLTNQACSNYVEIDNSVHVKPQTHLAQYA